VHGRRSDRFGPHLLTDRTARFIGGRMFVDIQDESDEVKHAVGVLVAEGITKGTSESTFNPGGLVTRRDMALFLHRIINREKE
jgi:hypothetical protein